jgi:hypothetical protein
MDQKGWRSGRAPSVDFLCRPYISESTKQKWKSADAEKKAAMKPG